MYVNGTAGTQDNSAPPIATAPGMDGHGRAQWLHAGAH